MCQQTKYQSFKSKNVLQCVQTLFALAVISSLASIALFNYPANAQTRMTIQPDGSLVPQRGAEPDESGSAVVKPDAAIDTTGNARAAPPAASSKPVVAATPVKLQNLTLRDETPAAIAVANARDALTKKAWAQLSTLVGPAQTDILGIYPAFWDLRNQLASNRNPSLDQALTAFLQRHPDTYLADKLKGEWILMSVATGDFETAVSLGAVSNSNSQIDCARLQANHVMGKRATADQAVKAFGSGQACWSLFDQLVADQVLTTREIIPLFEDAIEKNKVVDARKFASYALDKVDLQAYDVMMREPLRWLATQASAQRSAMRNEMVAIALTRMARGDLNATEAYLKREWQAKLPAAQLSWVYAQMALLSMGTLDPRADGFYHQAGLIRLSDNNHAWRVRAALRQKQVDWSWIVQCVDQMPTNMKAESAWLYWKARGLAALGKTEEAKVIYSQAGQQFNFYGQLALEEIGQQIIVPPAAQPVTAEELQQAKNHLGLQRAIALFKRGHRPDAVPEWNFALRGMNDRQLLAAAELARSVDIYDRVVNTSDRTTSEHDFTQRYIAPFENKVSAQAKSISLDTAWVYGLIRQESRFIMDAKSVVGASGLMQVMPATAKWVAKKIGMTDYQPGQVIDFDTNTKLGTSYMSMVLEDLGGSQVLASAGYNAGPGRPMQWRASLTHAVEGAIFAETIPFNETRDYVKNVLANATYYAAMFSGQPQSLKHRLGRIEPQPYGKSPLP
ncbi:soluble lytic murein transglycosylase [Jezberella montanilacus]|jgi:soluble lytic murein transglycosylase|uniref:Soluble lytic murein transglycosylase n=2 Tax=Jezberella montanilacus TaxID=323426 RepID=A0A2T0XBD7_9BURK|nr:soluble lytic murein transglycosylase [Jezberella montanilacus]